MMFTVRATIDEIAKVAARELCDCDLWETDFDDVTLVRMPRDAMHRFVHIINRMGIVWYMGRPRGRHADPTFYLAAQNVDGPDRTVRQ